METTFNQLSKQEIKNAFCKFITNKRRCDKSLLIFLTRELYTLHKMDSTRCLYMHEYKREDILHALFYYIELNDNFILPLLNSDWIKNQIVEIHNK